MITQELKDYIKKFRGTLFDHNKVDINSVQGYSEEEIKKIERLYDIKVTGQLYDFLFYIGRSSGGLFGDDILNYWHGSVRAQFLNQQTFIENLRSLRLYSYTKNKPFLISIENDTQYYFLLTGSDYPNEIFHYDENIDMFNGYEYSNKELQTNQELQKYYDENIKAIKNTGFTLEEYLQDHLKRIDWQTPFKIKSSCIGELIVI
jgi:hypothetical protein